nr:SOS response-associated peptidase [Synechococcus sp. CBW1107]
MASKPFFLGPWRPRRCLIPADGFYEWRPPDTQGPQTRSARKHPYWIRRQNHGHFWLGGLWDRWSSPDGSSLETCCILTTTANALLRPIHDRMPVVIPDGLEDTWLLASGADELRSLEPLLLPWQPAGWEAAPVDLS